MDGLKVQRGGAGGAGSISGADVLGFKKDYNADPGDTYFTFPMDDKYKGYVFVTTAEATHPWAYTEFFDAEMNRTDTYFQSYSWGSCDHNENEDGVNVPAYIEVVVDGNTATVKALTASSTNKEFCVAGFGVR